MRKLFAHLTQAAMRQDSRVWVLLGDVGYGVWDEVRQEFPDRCLNMGAAEQLMLGTAVGLATAGRVPLVYSISPFVLYRPFETIRNYLAHEQLPVKIIGSGRGQDYGRNGFSHWADEDRAVLAALPTIKADWPADAAALQQLFPSLINDGQPHYLNLCR